MPIRIATIEDDAQYRSSLELLFRHASEFQVVDSFGSCTVALERLDAALRTGEAPWDLVLMDVDLPGMDGIRGTRRIKALSPGMAVVVVTVFEERTTILEAICAGADGYLLKRTPADELVAQLLSIVGGGSPLSADVARTVLELVRHLGPSTGDGRGAAARVDLTERERDVLHCLVRGMSYKRAARELGISLDTVRSHIRSVYTKLQVHSVAEAVSRALREGIV
ncbi:MAG TPA: response regulator transcription factor [Gemmatimonadales bacterium]|nr:response regulator transcription factor [Gemmatimonadales bacterium]